MTDAATPHRLAAVVGRSLWGDAWARLKANRAAMVSLFYLALIGVVCVVRALFVPHRLHHHLSRLCAHAAQPLGLSEGRA